MTHRSRKEEQRYSRYLSTVSKDICVFCHNDREECIEETEYFKVIRNVFRYSIWDGQTVVDHLMIIPKLHVDALARLPAGHIMEFYTLMGGYELQGYNIYARAPVSAIKTVAHQHTH